MTVREKATVALAMLVFATAAAWGAHEILAATLGPLTKAVGS